MGRFTLKLMTGVALAAFLGPFTAWAAPQVEKEPVGTPAVAEASGTLLIVGGGPLPDAIRDRFLNLAGGCNARLVIIPTASERADRAVLDPSLKYWMSQRVASVRIIHTRDRRRANDPAFVKPLVEATGVWLTGGDQCRLVSAYGGTLVERELEQLLARGGVVGGTSAGASAMSGLMIEGGDPVARLGHGFGFLSRVVVDQHFGNRHRLGRLLGVLAKNPAYVGLGIDEESAVVVKGDTLSVLGNARVWLCLPASGSQPADVRVLHSGEHVTLVALHASASHADVAAANNRIETPVDRSLLSP
jgi:cyanophycinase